MWSERLRIIREELGLGQDEVAKRLGCSNATIWRYENGRFPDALALAIKLADLYGVSLDYLVGRTNEKKKGHLRMALLSRTQIV